MFFYFILSTLVPHASTYEAVFTFDTAILELPSTEETNTTDLVCDPITNKITIKDAIIRSINSWRKSVGPLSISEIKKDCSVDDMKGRCPFFMEYLKQATLFMRGNLTFIWEYKKLFDYLYVCDKDKDFYPDEKQPTPPDHAGRIRRDVQTKKRRRFLSRTLSDSCPEEGCPIGSVISVTKRSIPNCRIKNNVVEYQQTVMPSCGLAHVKLANKVNIEIELFQPGSEMEQLKTCVCITRTYTKNCETGFFGSHTKTSSLTTSRTSRSQAISVCSNTIAKGKYASEKLGFNDFDYSCEWMTTRHTSISSIDCYIQESNYDISRKEIRSVWGKEPSIKIQDPVVHMEVPSKGNYNMILITVPQKTCIYESVLKTFCTISWLNNKSTQFQLICQSLKIMETLDSKDTISGKCGSVTLLRTRQGHLIHVNKMPNSVPFNISNKNTVIASVLSEAPNSGISTSMASSQLNYALKNVKTEIDAITDTMVDAICQANHKTVQLAESIIDIDPMITIRLLMNSNFYGGMVINKKRLMFQCGKLITNAVRYHEKRVQVQDDQNAWHCIKLNPVEVVECQDYRAQKRYYPIDDQSYYNMTTIGPKIMKRNDVFPKTEMRVDTFNDTMYLNVEGIKNATGSNINYLGEMRSLIDETLVAENPQPQFRTHQQDETSDLNAISSFFASAWDTISDFFQNPFGLVVSIAVAVLLIILLYLIISAGITHGWFSKCRCCNTKKRDNETKSPEAFKGTKSEKIQLLNKKKFNNKSDSERDEI